MPHLKDMAFHFFKKLPLIISGIIELFRFHLYHYKLKDLKEAL